MSTKAFGTCPEKAESTAVMPRPRMRANSRFWKAPRALVKLLEAAVLPPPPPAQPRMLPILYHGRKAGPVKNESRSENCSP